MLIDAGGGPRDLSNGAVDVPYQSRLPKPLRVEKWIFR
jgi:hypothetical protein